MSEVAGTLITRNYGNFRGVDFSNRKDEINLIRSPDSKNMWKNYKNSNGRCIETRPDYEKVKEYDYKIYGIFFFNYNHEKHLIVHSGKYLYDENKIIYENMEENKSQYFIYNKNLYIKDGKNYLIYDGNSCNQVEGYIPTTTISRSPAGGGTKYEDINLLTGTRKNSFCADGETKEYCLDVEYFDSNSEVNVWIDDIQVNNFTYNASNGTVTFNEAPEKPLTDGQDNVLIQFTKTVEGYREMIEKCTLVQVFDTRVFFSGNKDYPNRMWHCSLEDPSYCSDLDYYDEGIDDSEIKSLIAGNNALWVLKEPSQTNTTIFYHNPTIDDEYGKVYPSSHSSITTGCVSTGINFNDDIVFFSERGMEGISGDITTEQVLNHRSSTVDNKMLNEEDYKNMILEEWEGYLLVIIGKNIYLADSRGMFVNGNHNEYEWFYWEFDIEIAGSLVKDGVLYLVSENKIYTLTKKETDIESYWTTIEDEFGYPHYRKTTNKRGCVIDVDGEEVTIFVKTDNDNFEKIETYTNVKGYVVSRIKKKKWKSIQLKFSSNKPFSLYSSTLESYVGSYVKR